MSRLFIESTDDLSFSRTYYPNRSVRIYLNGMAQQIYHKLYKNRRRENGAFKRFWVEELPDSMWAARKSLLLAFLIFAGGVALGLFSSNQNPEFVKTILGDQYVAMTEANIKKGDPMAVYKDSGALEMFFMIGWNNIRVSVLCFLAGLLFEVGTMFIVGSNAIMVGAFLYFFIERDLFKESFLAIMLHGSLELSMIVLAGAAGLTLGRGLVFPGSLSRSQALLLSARQGMRMMVGVSVFLVIAAFIESYATRHTDTPDIVRITIIVLSFAIVLWYFVIYPYRRHRAGLHKADNEIENAIPPQEKIELNAIKKTGQMMSEAWRMVFDQAGKFLGFAALAGCAVVGFLYFFKDHIEAIDVDTYYGSNELINLLNGLWFFDEMNDFFNFFDMPLLGALFVGLTTFILYQTVQVFKKNYSSRLEAKSNTLIFLNALLTSMLLLSVFFLPSTGDAIVLFITWPIVLLAFASATFERQGLFNSLSQLSTLLAGTAMKTYALFFLQVFMVTIALGALSAPLFYLIFDIVGSQFSSSFGYADDLIYALHAFLMFTSAALLFPVFVYTSFLQYFSNTEINQATELKARISAITLKKSAYGLEKEG
ncbi:MAG: stage II sporulation protein M [Flavobacteriales bacterium]|nr:stage II sporulation protein M [Flavobacteriales bacterium]